jgi:hypothetical protein
MVLIDAVLVKAKVVLYMFLTIIGGFIFGMSSQTWGGKTLSRRNLDR